MHALDVFNSGIKLGLVVAIMILAVDNLVGGKTDAFQHLSIHHRLECGSIDEMFHVIEVAERTAVCDVDS